MMLIPLLWTLGAVGVVCALRFWHLMYKFMFRTGLPPGTMGLPFFGETHQMYSQNPNIFFASKQRRYGEISKTHILGYPAVMMASPEAVKLVLVSQANLFKPAFPVSKQLLMGKRAMFFQHGHAHARMRNVLQSYFSLDTIRGNLSNMETLALESLKFMDGQPCVSFFEEMQRYTFGIGTLLVLGQVDVAEREEFKTAYEILEQGYNALPYRFPGTRFNRSLKARKRLNQMFSEVVQKRKERKIVYTDLLGVLMDKSLNLSHEEIVDNLIGLIFASRDTTASAITWLVKYLSMYPSLLASISAEHDKIREHKDLSDGLTWLDIRNMPLTSRFLQETLRVSTILSYTFREATEDVEYKGYIIPKGWKVMPLFRNIHHNPELYPDPYKFDSSRFEEPPKPNTFIPFGNGVHSCLGSELAKAEILILVHHLVTKFRWELVDFKFGVDHRPFPVPKNGLPLKITCRIPE